MSDMNFEFLLIFFSLAIIIFITFYINRVVLFKDPLLYKIKNDLILIDPKIKDISFYASNESFTEDKKRIYLCLKDKNDKYYPYNMLIYVALHETAHVLSPTIDLNHTSTDFINNFSNLIKKATELKLYDPTLPMIDHYCKSH
jgi:hypothetical protein